MPLDQKAVLDQIDRVIAECRSLQGRSKFDDMSDVPEEASSATSLLFAAIERLAPPGSSYVKNAKVQEQWLKGNIGVAVTPLIGVLNALRADYAAGNLQSITELIHADIFADFLEMADYLLQQGYKDAAAVVVGSVLEEHLRKLCQKNGIAVVQGGGGPKKTELLNSELAGSAVYTKLDQKSVTAWLDLRNKAAHGDYSEYTKEQVTLTLQGVQNFTSRHPA
jgi:hypothetical protein